MLRISLSKHHQFHIGRISTEGPKCSNEIANFIRRECQPKFVISKLERPPRCLGIGCGGHADLAHGLTGLVAKNDREVGRLGPSKLSHSVMQLSRQCR